MEGIKMECPDCHFENRKGAKFCKKCGIKIDLTCPKCSTLLGYDLGSKSSILRNA
jgi:hypothetical protein